MQIARSQGDEYPVGHEEQILDVFLFVNPDFLKIELVDERLFPVCFVGVGGVFHGRPAKVGENAERLAESFEIGDQLSTVQRKKPGNRLQFDDYGIFDQKVRSVVANLLVKIGHFEFLLPLDRKPL